MKKTGSILTLILGYVCHVKCEGAAFKLPTLNREPPKPTVPPDLANFFQLPDIGARKFVGSYFPGFIPPANFEVVEPYQQQQALLQSGNLGVLTANNKIDNQNNNQFNLPPSITNLLSQLPASFQNNLDNQPTNKVPSRNGNSTSSIAGIPNVFPSLPRAPIPQAASVLPTVPVRPEVPNGGLGPLLSGINDNNNLGVLSSGNVQASNANTFNLNPNASPFLPGSGLQPETPGGFASRGQQLPPYSSYPQQSSGNENLLNQLLKSVGLSSLGQNLDLSSINSILGLNPQQPPSSSQQSGLLSNVLYNALIDNNVQTQENSGNGTNVIDSKANAALIQNLLTQPTSPFCNPKPTPVEKFNINSFVGKWYQVLYSPPLSAGPCSMITYQKLADVGNGGPGTVFDTFEYTTEATPYGKPRISSGYGIIRGPGQLIYRTTNSPTDVNVFILDTGPVNVDNQYEYVVLAVNCNYPLHVFSRDPVVYKQKYEARVNALLEKKGLVTSWSRLLNMVAAVDYNLCTFPPSLFNVRG